MVHRIIAIAALVLSSTSMATDYIPAFDPSHFKGPVNGTPNQVLVLGTAHLRGMPASFDPKFLDLLLARLQTWQPQIITVEDRSGVQCDFMRHDMARYADSVKSWCWDPTPAGKETGLDVPAATAEAERLLTTWPTAATASQRRHLAAVFLAAGEQTSAFVQWLKLPTSEQIAGDGLNPVLIAHLQQLAAKRDESYLIAAPLAVRLGLERVYGIDDHTADSEDADEAEHKAYGAALEKAWDNPVNAKRSAADNLLFANVGSSEGVLALYKAFNQPSEAQVVYEGDFGAAMSDSSPQQFGRGYVGYWETRNLRMVSNIRDVLSLHPGKRTLTIVGMSHKGYFEAYLNMMHDVQLVDAEIVLH